MGLSLPDVPSVFTKPPNTIAHPGQTVVIPPKAQNEEMDYEVELAIVLSKECKNVNEHDAMDYVLGYTCANDLTARKVQDTSSQWGYAKGQPLCAFSLMSLMTPSYRI
jgi:2-keto-4-pentenoate hydratase/2-oxohepta-3-ene-1,7-dioic acid hydratase in catechol pathway